MAKIKSIVIIGSGNVATCFGKAFKRAGLNIPFLYSPDFSHAQIFANELNSKAVSSLKQLPSDADVYLLAVKDSVIKEVSDELDVKGTVVHCSGATSIEVLNKHKSYGVIWPLQTISKNFLPDKSTIPLCIEGNDENTSIQLLEFAKNLSDQVVMMNSQQRKYAHLAAVIANNFSNHLFDIAAQILQTHGLPFELLRPLIKETARKVQQSNPAEMQTGPARRNDAETIMEHLAMLKDHPEFRQIYETISHSIINQNKQSIE